MACVARSDRTDGNERTRAEHSWNSNNVASNVLLITTSGDAAPDRPANPAQHFQALRHFDEARNCRPVTPA